MRTEVGRIRYQSTATASVYNLALLLYSFQGPWPFKLQNQVLWFNPFYLKTYLSFPSKVIQISDIVYLERVFSDP